MFINPFISGLDPNIDKKRLLFESRMSNKHEYYNQSEKKTSLRNKFFLNKMIIDNNKFLKDKIKSISYLDNNWNNSGTPKINSEVIINSSRIINGLSASVLAYLSPENIYPTKMGTIIMDWEVDSDNILSLEIAKKSVGYFIEVNGDDYKELNNIGIENLSLIISSLTNDLSIIL